MTFDSYGMPFTEGNFLYYRYQSYYVPTPHIILFYISLNRVIVIKEIFGCEDYSYCSPRENFPHESASPDSMTYVVVLPATPQLIELRERYLVM